MNKIKSKFSINPIKIFIFFITIEVYILILFRFTEDVTVKKISYAISAIFFFFLLIINSQIKNHKNNIHFHLYTLIIIYYFGLIGSLYINYLNTDYVDFIKFIISPVYIIFGFKFSRINNFKVLDSFPTRFNFYTLITLPYIILIYELFINHFTFGKNGPISIFANRNNAGLYLICLLSLYNTLKIKPIKNIFVFMISGISFATIGVFSSIAFSICLMIGNRKQIVISLMTIALILFFIYNIEVNIFLIERIQAAIRSIIFIINGKINLESSYSEIVYRVNTTDLSVVFRLKHWKELLNIYINADFWNTIFGFGIGSSILLTTAQLAPHNDYIRLIFECGILSFFSFISMIFYVIFKCGRRWESIPLLTVILYFFSENLIDNYIAMSLFFYSSGSLLFRFTQKHEYSKNFNLTYYDNAQRIGKKF